MKNNSLSQKHIVLKYVSLTILSLMILVPLLEAFGRRFLSVGIPGSADWVQHLTLWIGLLGAIIATIKDNHLSVSLTQLFNLNRLAPMLKNINAIAD